MKELKHRRTTLYRRFVGEEAARSDMEERFVEWAKQIFRSKNRPEFKPGMEYTIRFELCEWDSNATEH
jgi:hypothetical protein